MKNFFLSTCFFGAVLLIAPVVVPAFVRRGSDINSERWEINIVSGHARYTRHLWFIKVSERIEDTPLSLALKGRNVETAGTREWHRVNTFSPPWVRQSPHYHFHYALYHANVIGSLFAKSSLSDAAKEEIAKNVLTLWQAGGNASQYIQELMEGNP